VKPLTHWKCWALLLGLGWGPVTEASPVLVVFPETVNTLGIQDELEALLTENGMALGRVLTPAQLERGLHITAVRKGVLDVACLDRVSLLEWKSTLQRAEMAVQIFRPKQAVDLTAQLEDQLVCLDGIPERKSLRTLYLTRALALNLEGDGTYALAEVIDQVLSLGTDLPEPVGLPPDLQNRLRQAGTRDNVRIFGGGSQGRLILDGQSLVQGAQSRGAGTHLVQLVDPKGQVSTALLMPFREGKTLLWAGELPDNPIQVEVKKIASKQQGSALLRAVSAVHRRTILVGSRKGGRLILVHVDGRVAARQGARKVLEKESSKSTRNTGPVAISRPRVVRAPTANWSWSAGTALGIARRADAPLPAGGWVFWGRAWAPTPVSFGLSAEWAVRPELLAPEQEDFYALHKALTIRPGVYWRGSAEKPHGELGVHGRFSTASTVVSGEGASPWGLGASVGFFAPVWDQAAWRVQLQTERYSGIWESGLQLGVEWSP
jgi:hypothetical protein